VGIGCEFLSSGHNLLIEDSWWTDRPRPHDASALRRGRDPHRRRRVTQLLRRIIIADIGDDGIDHSN
jgi:hypothetical protein